MKRKIAALIFLGAGLAVTGGAVLSNSGPEDAPALELSDHMRGFLKDEMLQLAVAGRGIEKALAAEDHASVQEFASHMDKAFIMQQEVTTMDLRELELVLGEEFVERDKEFHAMARALEAAAKAEDIVGERKIFGDMLRACAACHQDYAPEAPVLE
ncbi:MULTISPECIES: cytochrome c [Kordiimonas]|jgi:cytochrome c556|uniref:cytochrome c n=1 Tax=Kordiimonas TaxID=288021 RepID=UPI00257C6447|nr:cytochrome c [Kordiimonas sp. UBA4487]